MRKLVGKPFTLEAALDVFGVLEHALSAEEWGKAAAEVAAERGRFLEAAAAPFGPVAELEKGEMASPFEDEEKVKSFPNAIIKIILP